MQSLARRALLTLGFGFAVQLLSGMLEEPIAWAVPISTASAQSDTSTIKIQRANGQIDELKLAFKIDRIERSGNLLLVSGVGKGTFFDMQPITMESGDRLLSIAPDRRNAEETPPLVMVQDGPDPRMPNDVESVDDRDARSVADDAPRIGPNGPEPPKPKGVPHQRTLPQ